MSATVGTTLKIAAIAACVVVTAVALLRRDAYVADRPPDDAESVLSWVCPSCQRGFDLTARGYADKMRFGIHPDERARRGGEIARSVPIVPCKACGGWAVRANKCPADGTYFDAARFSAGHGRCPKCGWSPDGESNGHGAIDSRARAP